MKKPYKAFDALLPHCFIGVSLVGLCLLAAFTFNSPTSTSEFQFRRQFTGSIFGAICLLGIIAGASPSRCSQVPHLARRRSTGSNKTRQDSAGETPVMFRGHHPTCGNFSTHIFHLGGKAYCAGCVGMAVGAVISLLGIFTYLYAGLHVMGAGVAVFWLGFTGVTSGLLHNMFGLKSGLPRVFLNIMFVLGAFLLLIGIDVVKGNLTIELYLLTLIVYWIVTRTVLSRWEHRKICRACGLKSCSLSRMGNEASPSSAKA